MPQLRDSIDIGACNCLWTPDGGSEIELGLTNEGVQIDIEGESYEIVTHETGITPIDAVNQGVAITSEIQLVEYSLERVAAGLGALLTTVAGPPIVESVDISPFAGDYLPFGKLVFHPRRLESTDKSRDVTIWKAMIQQKGVKIFKVNDKGYVLFSVKAAATQDETSGEWKIYTFGDSSTDVTFPL